MISALGIVLFAVATTANSPSTVEATLAWGGAVSSSAFTEVALSAESTNKLTVTTISGSPVISTTLQSDGERSLPASIPVQPSGDGAVTLNVLDGNAPPVILKAGELQHIPAPVVVVGESVVARVDASSDLLAVAASDLPRLASAYTNIRALVIDGLSLSQVDEQQLRALLEHIGVCGRTLLVDVTPAVRTMLTQRAGCGGHALLVSQPAAPLDGELAALLRQPVDAMPGTNALSMLLGGDSADLNLIALFLAGFIIVFVILSSIPRTRLVALGFCVLATGLAAMLWNSAPRESFVAWSEVDNGDRIARYAAIERLTASARGDRLLQPQSLGRSPMEINGESLTLHWSAAAGERQMEWNASLLEEAQLVTAGSFPVEPNLRAAVDGDTATVCNQGTAKSPASWLRFQGSTYAVPALQPASSWSLVDVAPETRRLPELRLLARRMQRHSLALLQPLRVPENGGTQRAWLMRVESDKAEASPCAG